MCTLADASVCAWAKLSFHLLLLVTYLPAHEAVFHLGEKQKQILSHCKKF